MKRHDVRRGATRRATRRRRAKIVHARRARRETPSVLRAHRVRHHAHPSRRGVGRFRRAQHLRPTRDGARIDPERREATSGESATSASTASARAFAFAFESIDAFVFALNPFDARVSFEHAGGFERRGGRAERGWIQRARRRFERDIRARERRRRITPPPPPASRRVAPSRRLTARKDSSPPRTPPIEPPRRIVVDDVP